MALAFFNSIHWDYVFLLTHETQPRIVGRGRHRKNEEAGVPIRSRDTLGTFSQIKMPIISKKKSI